MRWSSLIGNISDRKGFFLSFILGFIIRSIPEVLSYPYPIGFDTVKDAAIIKSGIIWSHWTSVFSIWLLDAILISTHQITHIDPFLLLKLAAPFLYALNVSGIYYFSKKALNWDAKKALIAVFFFTFQLASLRLSWDLYRNMFGNVILLLALPLVKEVETKKGFVLFALLSLLVIFTHLLVSVVLLAIALSLVIRALLKSESKRALRIFASVCPALIVFLISLFPFSMQFDARTNVIRADEPPPRPGGLFFLVNYLTVADTLQYYPTYTDLFSHILTLFIFLYLLYLPLILVGFFRNESLDTWTLLLLVGSFGPLIMPFCALDYWNRWMFMLVFPFTFYAANGTEKVLKLHSLKVGSKFGLIKVSKKTLIGIVSLMVLLASIFTTTPTIFGDGFGVFTIPLINPYFPSTMLLNTIPLSDVRDTILVIDWLNKKMENGSSILVHYAFIWWVNLYLNKDRIVVYYVRDVGEAVSLALTKGFRPIYLIWWSKNTGLWLFGRQVWLYGVEVPDDFLTVFNSGRISVYSSLSGMYNPG
jgi:hypothetical protein